MQGSLAPGVTSLPQGTTVEDTAAAPQVGWKRRRDRQGCADLISHENWAGIYEIITPEGLSGPMGMIVLCVLLLRVGINNDLKVAVDVRN